MKNEENQGFTSFDFITMLFSFLVIVAISAPIIKAKVKGDSSMQVARAQATLIGQNLISPQMLHSLALAGHPEEKTRNIASVDEKAAAPVIDLASLHSHIKDGELRGEVGKDPWGQPYQFAFRRNLQGMPTHVVVWSAGADHKDETLVPVKGDVISNGDDVVSTIYIR